MPRILILGGTSDANHLADLVARARLDGIYSYAGRTKAPTVPPLPMRLGGFGGVHGLARFITTERISHVVDATHPFAADMSRHAITACKNTGTPLLALERPAWVAEPGDRWTEVPDFAAAVDALPNEASRVFLAIGRKHVAAFTAKPQHHYIARFVDPTREPLPLRDVAIITARGPFTLEGDIELMRAHGIGIVVARNAGGPGARAKIDAARELEIPIVMITRPDIPYRPTVPTADDVMMWLSHAGCSEVTA